MIAFGAVQVLVGVLHCLKLGQPAKVGFLSLTLC